MCPEEVSNYTFSPGRAVQVLKIRAVAYTLHPVYTIQEYLLHAEKWDDVREHSLAIAFCVSHSFFRHCRSA